MERRLFIKKSSTLATGVLALSTLECLASEKEEINIIDLVPYNTSKIIKIEGMIVDSLSLRPIPSASINVKVNRNRFIASNRSIERTKGNYTIQSGFSSNGKFSEKMAIEIKAAGYKTYKGNLYLSQNGCNIHSEEWEYNPNFKEDYLPINKISEGNILSSFHFRLIK